MGGKARAELLGRFGGEVLLGSGCNGGGAGRLRDEGAKGFTALLGGDQFMGIQPESRYSLNASSGGMQRRQLECVSR